MVEDSLIQLIQPDQQLNFYSPIVGTLQATRLFPGRNIFLPLFPVAFAYLSVIKILKFPLASF
jgi:hypothetical protein